MSFIFALICFTAIVAAKNVPPAPTAGSAPPQPPAPGCTTLQPLFGFPSDGTSTVFPTITTEITTVNCRGCTPTIQIFNFSVTDPPPSPTTTVTNTEPLTFFEVSCLPFTPLSATISTTPSIPPFSPTAKPVPPVSAEAQELINELRTANLYVLLIANGGFQDVLCSGLNPPLLSNNTGINGTAVQTEVCLSAGIQLIDPPLFPLVVAGNQIASQRFVEIALYAVQVAAGYGGVSASKKELQKLCDEIEEAGLNAVFQGYLLGGGTKTKNFVCNAAKRK